MIYFTEKEQSTQAAIKTTAGSVCVALVDYQAMNSDELSFSKGEELEITETSGSYWWEGRSLLTGHEGYIPSSCVDLSMLKSLQLLQFVLTEQKVCLPILQKIKDDSCINDDKASLFLKSINDDPILLAALRQDKEQHEEGIMCGWDSFDFIFSFV